MIRTTPLKTLTSSHRKPSEYGKVGVLMGGESSEREVSLTTGNATLAALREAGIDAHAVDVSHATLLQVLQQQNFDMVFIALHGGAGENGQIQALLDFLRIPYTGSGMEACAITMNKQATKDIWQSYGLPVLPGEQLQTGFNPQDIIAQYGLPLVVKPAHEGSTMGVARVDSLDELLPAFKAAQAFGDDTMTEPWVVGEEYTVGIVGEDVLPSIKIKPADTFYDYHAKYVSNDTEYLIPSGLTSSQEQALQEISYQAYKVVGCEGWARLDFICDQNGKMWLLEINTVPGLTDHSLVPKAVKALGYSFIDLILAIMESALKRKKQWSECA